MKLKSTVLTDMDDTMEDLLPAWIDILNRKAGTNVQPSEVTDWHIPSFFPGLPKQEIFNVLETEELWKNVKPKEGAPEYIKRLMDDGHKVFVVTTSGYKTIVPKMEHVLFKYFPFLGWDNVIITSEKSRVHGDVLIDDGVHNLETGLYEKLLMDAPHNRLFDEKKIGAIRVMNWEQVYDTVTRINQRKVKELVDFVMAKRV